MFDGVLLLRVATPASVCVLIEAGDFCESRYALVAVACNHLKFIFVPVLFTSISFVKRTLFDICTPEQCRWSAPSLSWILFISVIAWFN